VLNLRYSCSSRILRFLYVLGQLGLNLCCDIISWRRLEQSLIRILSIALERWLLIRVGTFEARRSLPIKSAYSYITWHKILASMLKLVIALIWWEHGWLLHKVIVSLRRWLFCLTANLGLFVAGAALRTIYLELIWDCKGIPKLERLRVIPHQILLNWLIVLIFLRRWRVY